MTPAVGDAAGVPLDLLIGIGGTLILCRYYHAWARYQRHLRLKAQRLVKLADDMSNKFVYKLKRNVKRAKRGGTSLKVSLGASFGVPVQVAPKGPITAGKPINMFAITPGAAGGKHKRITPSEGSRPSTMDSLSIPEVPTTTSVLRFGGQGDVHAPNIRVHDLETA